MNQLKETVAPGEIIPAVQLCPIGDWPKGEIVQHCDRVAKGSQNQPYDNV